MCIRDRCTAILQGIAAQRAREGPPVPRRVQDRMDRGTAVFDLAAAGEQLEESEGSIGMDDADITDIADFQAVDAGAASAVPERSGERKAGPGGRTYCGDITGAALGPELVASARSEEIRFVGSWHAWDVRPISER
eukprot:7470723-Alexandrium_andersonii.AAC.1